MYNNFENRILNTKSAVFLLIVINLIFFGLNSLLPGLQINEKLAAYYPTSSNYHFYQVITHMFLHAGFFHIFFNMFNLYMFGFRLEQLWGKDRFLLFYMICGLGAFFLYMLVKGFEIYQITGSFLTSNTNDAYVYMLINTPTVGASGAIYGLLAAYGYYFANSEIYLYGIVPIRVKWFVLGLIAISLFYGIQNNPGDNVAHFAHLGGALFGFILVKIWNKNRNVFY